MITVPVAKTEVRINEEEVKDFSSEQCLALRQQIRNDLEIYNRVNPGQLHRLLGLINERMFELNQFTTDAHEG